MSDLAREMMGLFLNQDSADPDDYAMIDGRIVSDDCANRIQWVRAIVDRVKGFVFALIGRKVEHEF